MHFILFKLFLFAIPRLGSSENWGIQTKNNLNKTRFFYLILRILNNFFSIKSYYYLFCLIFVELDNHYPNINRLILDRYLFG
jgi:hypothetical protein